MAKGNEGRLGKTIHQELTCVIYSWPDMEFVEGPWNVTSLCRGGYGKFYFGGQNSLECENAYVEIIQK